MKITVDELIEVLKKLPDFKTYRNERVVINITASVLSIMNLSDKVPPVNDRLEFIEFYKDHRVGKWRLS